MKICIYAKQLNPTMLKLKNGLTNLKTDDRSGLVFVDYDGVDLYFSTQSDIVILDKIEKSAFDFSDNIENKPFNFAINGKQLIEFVSKCNPESTIHIFVDKTIKISCDAATITFISSSILSTNIKELVTAKNECPIMLTAEKNEFIDLTSRTLNFTAKDTARPILQGVNFKAESDIYVAALDGFRLALTKLMNCKNEGDKNIDITIPTSSIVVIINLLSKADCDVATFFVMENQIIVEIENTLLKLPLLSGKFIDYNSILPHNEINLTFNTQDFLRCIDIAKICSDHTNLIKLIYSAEKNVMQINSQNEISESDAFVTPTKSSYDKDFIIACNCTYVYEALKQAKSELVEFSFRSSNTPFTIKTDVFYSLILPMRIG